MLRRTLLTTLLASLSLAVSVPALAKDPKELVIGTSAARMPIR
jgi:hypothetical protein